MSHAWCTCHTMPHVSCMYMPHYGSLARSLGRSFDRSFVPMRCRRMILCKCVRCRRVILYKWSARFYTTEIVGAILYKRYCQTPSKQLTVVARTRPPLLQRMATEHVHVMQSLRRRPACLANHEPQHTILDAVGFHAGKGWCISSLPGECNASASQC